MKTATIETKKTRQEIKQLYQLRFSMLSLSKSSSKNKPWAEINFKNRIEWLEAHLNKVGPSKWFNDSFCNNQTLFAGMKISFRYESGYYKLKHLELHHELVEATDV